jgi:hypothetical protein
MTKTPAEITNKAATTSEGVIK